MKILLIYDNSARVRETREQVAHAACGKPSSAAIVRVCTKLDPKQPVLMMCLKMRLLFYLLCTILPVMNLQKIMTML